MKKVTTNRAVKTSCKNTKVRTASGACAPERKPMMEGGGTTESCGPGKPKGCGYAKAQRKNSRSKLASKVLPVVGKVLTTAATIGGLAYGAMKGKKMLENKQVGGPTINPARPRRPVPMNKPTRGPAGPRPVKTSINTTPTREPRIKFGDPMVGIPASKPKPKGRYEDAVENNSTRTKAAVKSVSRPIKSNGPGTPASRTAAIPKSRSTAAEFKAGMVASPVSTLAKKAYGMMKKNGGSVHPGFSAIQSSIAAKQGISKEAAGAILASSARKASAKAKAKNPRLKKVK